MSEEYYSIRVDKARCQGSMACMRVCPTEAIRVRNRKATLLHDRCIDCGDCVHVCPTKAIVPQTSSFSDFSAFKHTIAVPSPVLYSQFDKGVEPADILKALTRIGFDDAYDATCPSEAVSIAIQEYLDAVDSPRPLISPFCPAIVRLIQILYPNLLDHLIPIDSPMQIAAREAKHLAMQRLGLKERQIGAIYLTPCPAKMLAIKSPPRKRHSFLDGAIAIADIFPSILKALHTVPAETTGDEVHGLGLGWPILGGQISCLRAEETLAIAGISHAIRVFEEIEIGKLQDIQYIEVYACPTGCVGGSLNVENPYIARGRVLRAVQKYGGQPCQDREKIRDLYRKKFFSLPGTIPSAPVEPLDRDMSRALQKLQQKQHLYGQLPGINCGACGSPTCESFAEDVVTGQAKTEDCVFVAMRHFADMSGRLLTTVTQHSRRIPYFTEADGENAQGSR